MAYHEDLQEPAGDLYPSPPHLSIGVFCGDSGDAASMARVCAALLRAGGGFTGDVMAAPKGVPFFMTNDIGGDALRMRVEGLFDGERMVEQRDIDILKAGFRMKAIGLIVAGFDYGEHGRHPVSLTMGAADLGLPADVRRKHERRKAKKISAFALRLMRSICEDVDPLYGSIGIEASLPDPSRVASGDFTVDDVYISKRLLRSASADPQVVRSKSLADHLTEWNTGFYLSAFSEFGREVGVNEHVTPDSLHALLRYLVRKSFGF